MELRHLRYFIAAAEEQHFGRASERLHVTRPAVSQIIADLEDEIGTPLFERLGHRVRLTAAGRALLPELQSVMQALSNALVTAKRVGQGKSGALNIGYGSMTMLHPLFRDAIKEFHLSCPDVSLSLSQITTAAQLKALAEGRIHAGFLHFAPQSRPRNTRRRFSDVSRVEPALETFRIQTGSLGVAFPADHRFAGRASVALADLATEEFVVVPGSTVSPSYGKLYSLCVEAGFEPKIVQEVSTIASQLDLVSVGMGIGLIVMGKHFAYPSRVVVIPLSGVAYTTSFELGWAKGSADPALARFVEVVKRLSARR